MHPSDPYNYHTFQGDFEQDFIVSEYLWVITETNKTKLYDIMKQDAGDLLDLSDNHMCWDYAGTSEDNHGFDMLVGLTGEDNSDYCGPWPILCPTGSSTYQNSWLKMHHWDFPECLLFCTSMELGALHELIHAYGVDWHYGQFGWIMSQNQPGDFMRYDTNETLTEELDRYDGYNPP